jgi:hypothetical protein
MKSILRVTGSILVAIAIVAGLACLAFLCIRTIWQELVAIKPELAVAVVAASATLIGSTVTVMLGRHFERKKDIEAHFRAEKIKIYDEFLAELFKLFHSGSEGTDDMVAFLREWQRKLVLWGGSNVLGAYFKWMSRLKGTPDAQTMFLMDEFFRALRADVGQGSSGLPKGAFAHLVLRRGEFFLEQAKRNPKITLVELSHLEKQVFGDDA